MFSYLMLALWPGLMAAVIGNNHRILTLASTFLTVLFIAIFVGLRFEVGYDWSAYMRHYYITQDMELRSALFTSDPGYAFLNWVAANNGLGIGFVNIITSLLGFLPIFLISLKLKHPVIFIMALMPVYIISISMGSPRQFVAISWVFFAVFSSTTGAGARHFLLCIAIATLFHKSAIIFTPVHYLLFMDKRLRIALLVIAGASIYFFINTVSDVFGYAYYISQSWVSGGALFRTLYMSLGATAILLSLHHFPSKKTKLVFQVAALTVLLYLPLSFFGYTALDRIALYLVPFCAVGIERFSLSLPDSLTLSIYFLSVLALSIFVSMVWLMFANSADAWLPYQIVWN